MKKKPRIECFSCKSEKIITQSVCWVWKGYNYWFCTNTCASSWMTLNLKDYYYLIRNGLDHELELN